MSDSIRFKIKSIVPEDWDIVLIFFFLALALRLYFALAYDVQPQYKEMSTLIQFAELGEYDKFLPPLYILFLRIIFRIFGFENFKAVYVIQGIVGALTVIPMYVICRKLCNRIAGGIAAAITAIYPNYILYTLTTLPDTLSIFLVVMLMYTAVIQINDARRAYISAVFSGIGILIKPIFWYLIPGMLISIKKRFAYLLIIIAILAPWVAYSSMQSKRFVPGYHPWSYRFDLDKYTQGKDRWHAVEKIYTNTSYMLKKSVILSGWTESQKRSTYAAEYSYLVIMLLGFGGMIRYYRKKHRAVALPVLMYAALLILFSQVHGKSRSLLEPLLILYAAILAGTLCQRIRFKKSAKPTLESGNSE